MTNTHPVSILIVDNDEDLGFALDVRLSSVGYRCCVVSTGAQALSTFNDQHFDLVITDLNMPNINGVDLVHDLRNLSDIPILVITGFEREFHESIVDLPVVMVLTKPFQADDLLDMVEMSLSLRGIRLAG